MIGKQIAPLAAAGWFALAPALWAQDRMEGKKVYQTYCSGCHGDSGKGDGPAARSLPVKPADHTDRKQIGQYSDQLLFDMISKGGSRMAKSAYMPAWGGQLKDQQIRDLVAYIRSLSKPER